MPFPAPFSQAIRDPIHGMLPLTPCEWDLLRTRAMSRLRGIRQMGMAYVIFPGAHHTRFEHMIGAMHTAWLLCEGLSNLDDEDRLLVRLAAMTHDLGHRPFSHSLEDAARRFADRPELSFLARFVDHEDRTQELLARDPEIGEVLARYPEYRWLDREELALLAVGKHPRHELNLFIHSEIDADRIDYVLRDNYYCGFAPGVDIQALRDLYVPDREYGLVINADRTYVAQQLLSARYHLISNIQNNPTSRLGDLLLARAISDALAGSKDLDQARFVRILDEGTDSDLEHFLRERAGTSWSQLQAMVEGKEPFRELVAYDASVLSPFARYAMQSLRLSGASVAQQLEDALAPELDVPILVDITRVKAPVDPLRYSRKGNAPWHGRLTEMPTVRGIIDASLDGLTLRTYVAPDRPLALDEATFDRWVGRYQALDPSLSRAKAEGILADLWGGDRARLGLLLELETFSANLLAEQVTHAPSRLDLLFLTCYTALTGLEDALGELRLYLDGREALWQLIRSPEVRKALPGNFPAAYEGSELSGTFLTDVAYLVRCGLLYAPTRLERVKNVFVERPKYGATGWGRRLERLMLESAERAGQQSAAEQLATAVRELLLPNREVYREYFSLLATDEPTDAIRRRELRRLMPVPVSR